MTCERGTSNRKASQTGSSCQCSTTSSGRRKEMLESVFPNSEKSRSTRKDSRIDTGRSSLLEMKRSGKELFLKHLKKMDSTATQMEERFHDTGHSVFKSISALSCGNSEKEEWQRHHTLQCGCFEHRALIPNHSFCNSAHNLLSSYELV